MIFACGRLKLANSFSDVGICVFQFATIAIIQPQYCINFDSFCFARCFSLTYCVINFKQRWAWKSFPFQAKVYVQHLIQILRLTPLVNDALTNSVWYFTLCTLCSRWCKKSINRDGRICFGVLGESLAVQSVYAPSVQQCRHIYWRSICTMVYRWVRVQLGAS